MSNTPAEKILALASAITNLITSHYNITGSSQQKGHTQAGGAPQSIGDSLSAGTDNGYYARADHVHTATTSHVKDTNAYSNLNISANSTQQQINYAINQRIINTVDEKPTYMSIDDDLNFYVGYDPIINTTLTANKAVIQSGQTSTLSATVKTTNNALLEGAPVEFYNGNTLLGNGVSNSSGIASYTYTGSGAGKQTITAKAGSVVSQPYEVLDCAFYDSGVEATENTDWIVSSGTLSKSFSSDGKTISPSTSTNLMIYANKPSTTGTSAYDWNAPFVVEFDVNAQTDTPQFQVYSNDTTGAYNLNLGNTGHYKITYDGTTVYGYRDGTEINHFDRDMSNARIGFVVGNGKSLTYKGFKIY